jgi:hypothetical protein
MSLALNKRVLIGSCNDGSKIYDYGSKFFALTNKNELLEKSFSMFTKEPFKLLDTVYCEKYEYLDEVMYSNRDDLSVSAVLDLSNVFVKGNWVDLDEETINGEKFTFCSSVDYVDFDERDEIYPTLIKVCQIAFDDNSIDCLSVLDEEEERYFSFVLYKNSVAFMNEDDLIYTFSLDERKSEENMHLARCALLAVERIAFDELSLLSLDEIENRELLCYLKKIDSITLNDVSLISIALLLEINYKSLKLQIYSQFHCKTLDI